MTGYWFNCDKCDSDFKFRDIAEYNGISSFLWYKFFESDCDQSLLTPKCPKCKGILRITYDFPRKEKITAKVRHIVFQTDDDYFFQMLWETFFTHDKTKAIYDFKYMNGNSPNGLTKSVIMTEADLKKLIQLFNKKCHKLLK
jgi:hypothetical protein